MDKVRSGEIFGMDAMVYEDGLQNHSTCFLNKIDEHTTFLDLIREIRIAGNARKALRVEIPESGTLDLKFVKKL